jgi:aspartyl-tRNA(Asn)/glutamyl-tRNA(Gln) amidotransferase subunit A
MKSQHAAATPSANCLPLPGSISDIGRYFRNGSLTAAGLTRNCLHNIGELQPALNAFITVAGDSAFAEAARLDEELRCGADRGPLHGIPIAIKDNIDVAGLPVTGGAEIFRHRIAAQDAEVVRRLRHAGVAILGKSNMSEFGASISGKNPFYGDVCNPWDGTKITGGSSMGGGAAVACGLAVATVCTDAGGSLRHPALRMGIVGFRFSRGRVTGSGLRSNRSKTVSAFGTLTRQVSDAALLLNAMADVNAGNAEHAEDFIRELDRGVRNLRLGVADLGGIQNIDQSMRATVLAAGNVFRSLGADVETIDAGPLTDTKTTSALFRTLIRYETHELLKKEFWETEDRSRRIGAVITRDILAGSKILKQDYERAQAQREELTARALGIFEHVDAVLTPSVPNLAPLQDDPEVESAHRGESGMFLRSASLFNLPSISVPTGLGPDGLPTGILISVRTWEEAKLIQIAQAFENVTQFYRRYPPLCDHEGRTSTIL